MLTPSEIADNRTDLLTFTKTMFKARKGIDFVENWHHAKICAALERVVIGDIKRLIINLPPRYSKTELAVVNFIAWCMGNFPDSEFIHSSYSKRLATNNSWAARSLVEHELFADIFGAPQLRRDSNAKDEWRTDQGGCVYATGTEGTITGYGAGGMIDRFKGGIIIDDAHKAGEANSPVMRQNVLDWFSTTLESRTNSPDTPIIIIMQRLHEEDLAGWLLNGGNGEEWTHLNIPVRDENEQPLWPFKHSAADLDRMEAANPYVFAGQYMQRPAPLGGGTFKDSWWRYYSVLPNIESRNIYADTAQKTKEQNDYSVFQCWGKSGNDIYLIDMIRGKWEAPELLRRAKAFWSKHKAVKGLGSLRRMKIEDKSSGTGLIQTLKKDTKIPVSAVQRSIDKVTRALDATPYIESGHVYLPDGAPFVSDILSESSAFPNGTHDDTLDPLMDAIADNLNAETSMADLLKLATGANR